MIKNQNCQKIKLHGSPTTKKLKKKHLPRLVGGTETGNWGGEDRVGRSRLADQVVPHSHVDKLGRTTGEQDKPRNPGFQHREIKPQNLWLKKPVGIVVARETSSLTGKSVGEAHGILEHTQAHLPRNSTWKDCFPTLNLLMGSEGSDRKWSKSQASGTVPSLTPPPQTVLYSSKEGCPALLIPKALLLRT